MISSSGSASTPVAVCGDDAEVRRARDATPPTVRTNNDSCSSSTRRLARTGPPAAAVASVVVSVLCGAPAVAAVLLGLSGFGGGGGAGGRTGVGRWSQLWLVGSRCWAGVLPLAAAAACMLRLHASLGSA